MTSPACFAAGIYRGVRYWPRWGGELPGQSSLIPWDGSKSVSRCYDCQPYGGRERGSGGMVNPGKPLVNAVMYSKPKRLTGLDQKVCGQGQGVLTPLAQMLHHRRRGGTSPTWGHLRDGGSPVTSPWVGTSQEGAKRERGKEGGARGRRAGQ